MNNLILNVILFQLGWFACVLGGAASLPLAGVLVALGIMGFHLWRASEPKDELYLMLIAMGIGALWDSLLVMQSLVVYTSGTLITHTAPIWIVAMWGLFASTMNVSMRWLKHRYWLAALLGGVAGPMAYYGGAQLGGLTFINLELGLMHLAFGWAVFTPLLVKLGESFDGYPEVAGGSQ
ncbi:MAG: hypothetical protein AUK35_08435 [Zetaproteobacteria bacterium CG2_30_46_52]|nr:MAG: hypothetical protein AUK35_08435 [Zetaproteobacteria bacterium CG2_30_46_52]